MLYRERPLVCPIPIYLSSILNDKVPKKKPKPFQTVYYNGWLLIQLILHSNKQREIEMKKEIYVIIATNVYLYKFGCFPQKDFTTNKNVGHFSLNCAKIC